MSSHSCCCWAIVCFSLVLIIVAVVWCCVVFTCVAVVVGRRSGLFFEVRCGVSLFVNVLCCSGVFNIARRALAF